MTLNLLQLAPPGTAAPAAAVLDRGGECSQAARADAPDLRGSCCSRESRINLATMSGVELLEGSVPSHLAVVGEDVDFARAALVDASHHCGSNFSTTSLGFACGVEITEGPVGPYLADADEDAALAGGGASARAAVPDARVALCPDAHTSGGRLGCGTPA